MHIIEIFLIVLALSMDAFAVSISDGLAMPSVPVKQALAISLTFGSYQFLMPVAGYIAASFFYRFIQAIDHWIAFALLGVLGGRMIAETLREMKRAEKAGSRDSADSAEKGAEPGQARAKGSSISFRTLMLQGIATSIDALAVGISFAAMPDLRSSYSQTLLFSAVYPALLIGLTTTCLCLPAVYIGKKTGDALGDKAQLLGGAILIGIGVKILIEHVFFGG